MNKIQPKIFNGGWQLVMSETVCCNPSRELEVHLPVTPESVTMLRFVFITDSNLSKSNLHTTNEGNNEGNTVTFTLTNFLKQFGAFLNPFEFSIGADRYFLQMHGMSASRELLNLTISIFKKVA